ncbi:MAG: hypothetical protein JWQ80_1410, partial [Massilia sp.]|nr:hypothetical protein [Massilia sp.]
MFVHMRELFQSSARIRIELVAFRYLLIFHGTGSVIHVLNQEPAGFRASNKTVRARRIVEDSTIVRRDGCNAAMAVLLGALKWVVHGCRSKPALAFLRLVYFRIALFSAVPDRWRCRDPGRVDNAPRAAATPCWPVSVDFVKDPARRVVLPEQAVECARRRRLVRQQRRPWRHGRDPGREPVAASLPCIGHGVAPCPEILSGAPRDSSPEPTGGALKYSPKNKCVFGCQNRRVAALVAIRLRGLQCSHCGALAALHRI